MGTAEMKARPRIIENPWAEIDRLEAENAKLRAALCTYGRHKHPCAIFITDGRCDCGLEAALSDEEPKCESNS
jgi:hypothetical protein